MSLRYGAALQTGANEFFYLDAQKIQEWGIEEEFLKPVIKTCTRAAELYPYRSKSVEVQAISYALTKKSDLAGTNAALEYIRWGESQGFQHGDQVVQRASSLVGPMEHRIQQGFNFNYS